MELIRGVMPIYDILNGDGSGDGSGDGYGDGDGSGDGSGYGSGDGDGYGSGDGSGYGSGYGYGYGYGDGSGYGSGDGYWTQVAINHLPVNSFGEATVAFWNSNAEGKAANGGLMENAATLGLVEEIAGPLKICTKNGLHGTIDPTKWKGCRHWLVALWGEVQRQDDKLASLKREIICEIT
jgi:hypothetical protein